MSQKDYKTQIIQYLLKKECHIRGLAKELGTNQTTVARKINELYKENAVDYRQEGKNKVFFLKKTIEAKQYAYIAEMRKLIGAVKRYPRLRTITEEIRKNKSIRLALIFGSYAKSAAGTESDIDIYIETKSRKVKDEVSKIDSKLSIKIGSYDRQSPLIREIEKNHIIIKGVEEFYEKSQLFE